MANLKDIKIGTLVNTGMGAPKYIKEILPYGFESFSLVFWQTTKGVDWQKLADEVNKVLDGTDAVISSLGVYGNPLEKEELDLETLKGFNEIIDNAHLFKCDIVAGFTGRLRGKPIHENINRFKEIWTSLAEKAGEKGLRDRKSTRLNSSHIPLSRMPSSA